ncbi:MAG: diguanylate cyclase, partial [Geminicoccaceae bacterium]|nr:diguanylate cyclase [Geminicoccaceae bacterium]
QDQLTGLANRSLLEDRLERALAFARRNDRLVAIMILDLNGFKRVNDGLGHAAGDRLLCIVAERLRARLRETDTIARTGGDEFALVIENLARAEHAALVAQKLLDAVAPPVALGGREVCLSASLGIALYPKDGDTPSELQRLADAAMYRAKSEGGNVFRFSSPQVERRVQRGALLASDVRRGLERNEFVLHYQPQVALAPTRLGLAAMPVWQHPELGPIAADRFLGLAEAAGLSESLMDWLVGAAVDQLTAWRDFGLERLHLALPMIVRRQLAWSDVADRLAAQIRRGNLPPQAIEIEVDEAHLLADLDAGGNGAERLRAVGVRLSIDGYGIGPTSLRSFQRGLVDTVKLDRSLIAGVPEEAGQTATMTAILELARRLGIRTVASGADRHDQVAFLRAHGCTAVQALMSCPAVPAEACARWLERAVARRDCSIRALEPVVVADRGRTPLRSGFRI